MDIPSHIPEELVWDHDLDAFTAEFDDPFLAGCRLHDGPDIVWGTRAFFGQPAWILTRHARIQEAFLDYEHFSSRIGRDAGDEFDENWRLIPVQLDPPEHQLYRQILNPYFTPRSLRTLEEDIRGHCDNLITRFGAPNGCEFISEFARRFPNYVFLSLMGMPYDMLPQFLEWEDGWMRGSDEAKRAQASQDIFDYLTRFIEEQRANPTTALMGMILGGEINGCPLTEIEVLGICFTLFLGGLDSVYGTLGWVMRHLAADQPLQRRLRDNPRDIPLAVEELTRAFAVSTPHRTVVEDFSFHGVAMRKGERVVLPTYLAGRDPLAFENPHVVDIDRRPRHMTFATGPHACLGVHLAKSEVRFVIEAFLSRFENLRIPEGERVEYHVGSLFGVDRLPLEWDLT